MNEINLHNYEAWFLDYMEGNLTEAQQVLLVAFLKQYPELKEELYAFDNEVVLSPALAEMEHKEALKAPHAKDFDTLLISYLEGQLSEVEKKKTEQLLNSNPNIAGAYVLYQKTILEPDYSIVFPDKQKLKKGKGKLVRMYWYSAVAAAACLLIFALNFTFNSSYELQDKMVEAPADSLSNQKIIVKAEGIVPDAIEILAEAKKSIIPAPESVKQRIITPELIEEFREPKKENHLTEQKHPEKTRVVEDLDFVKPLLVFNPIDAANKLDAEEAFAVQELPRSDGFLSPKELLVHKVKSLARGKGSKNVKNDNLTAWEIAETGITKISRDKVKIERTQDEHGSGFAFITDKFEFSTRSSSR
jgi:hypothetical protein